MGGRVFGGRNRHDHEKKDRKIEKMEKGDPGIWGV